MAVYECEKYLATKETLLSTLTKYGVAIIPSVLSDQECEAMIRGMWETLATITQRFDTDTTSGPISETDQSTWRSFYNLFPLHSMLVQHHQIGHAQYIWELRQNKKILDIWTHLWSKVTKREVKDSDLLVSFDAVSYHFPPEITGKGWLSSKGATSGWLHTDQSYKRNGFECVQSWVTALDVNEGDGTLTILEGSHRYHGEFAKKFGVQDPGDWYKLESDEQRSFYLEKGCVRRSIKCPKGSLVFWDSRTIHSGQEPIRGRKEANFRCVAYLCYSPRSLATEQALVKKRQYFEEQRMTSHWPHKIKVFGKTPRLYGGTLPDIAPLPKPKLRAIGRILAGYEPRSYQLDDEGYAVVIYE